MYNYEGKTFKSINHSANGETVEGSLFFYRQKGNIVTCEYESPNVVYGQLMALVGEDGSLDMRYHQVNKKGEIRTGHCFSRPEQMKNGKLRLHEKWEWTSGDYSEGSSIIEEQ